MPRADGEAATYRNRTMRILRDAESVVGLSAALASPLAGAGGGPSGPDGVSSNGGERRALVASAVRNAAAHGATDVFFHARAEVQASGPSRSNGRAPDPAGL